MKKNKLLIVIGAAVLIGIVSLLAYKEQKKSLSDNVIRIGAILPMTGQFSTLGVDAYKGIEGGVATINSRGGVMGRKLEVIYEDSKGEPRTGIAKYQKLRDVDNVNVMICGLSHVTKAIVPMAEKDRRIIISTIASASNFASNSKWLFRIFTSADVETRVAADFIINNLKAKKIALLREDSDSGNDASRLFGDRISKLGGQLVLDEVPEKSQEYVNMRAKLDSVDYDAVYVYCGDIRLGSLIKTAASAKKNVPIVTLPIINNEPIQKQLIGISLPKVFYPNLETTQEFNANLLPNISTVFGYSIVLLLSEAIETASSLDNEQILKSLLELHDRTGAIRNMSITLSGDVDFPMVMKEYKSEENKN